MTTTIPRRVPQEAHHRRACHQQTTALRVVAIRYGERAYVRNTIISIPDGWKAAALFRLQSKRFVPSDVACVRKEDLRCKGCKNSTSYHDGLEI